MHELFPPEQVHVLVAEDLFAEPQATYDALVDFLGLPPARPHRPAGLQGEPLRAAARRCAPARLSDYYAKPNEELFELLGRRADWL